MTQVTIGKRVFQVRESLGIELILLLEKGKRFWEWEKEIATLKKMLKPPKKDKTLQEVRLLLEAFCHYMGMEFEFGKDGIRYHERGKE